MSIKVLPQEVISLMAAGEVIHRPSDVLKELLENALDAEARHIKIELMQGGLEKIKVSDDGKGIPKESLPLALEAHATSKLGAIEDLQKMRTYGFRGEALYAIQSIANFSMSSFPQGEKIGYEISKCLPEREIKISPIAMEQGTTVQVNQLFAPYPVRRKFLKSPRLEWQHCQKIVMAMAIIRYDISWSLSHNLQSICRYRAVDSLQKRLEQMFSSTKTDQIWKTHKRVFDQGSIEICYQSIGTRGLESWWYMNKRYILDPALKKLLSQYLPMGKACLQISIHEHCLDPNLHPQKLIVGLSFYEGFVASLQDFFSEIFPKELHLSYEQTREKMNALDPYAKKSVPADLRRPSFPMRTQDSEPKALASFHSNSTENQEFFLEKVAPTSFGPQQRGHTPSLTQALEKSLPLSFIPLNRDEILVKLKGGVYHFHFTALCSELLKTSTVKPRRLLIPFSIAARLKPFFLEHGFLFKGHMLTAIPHVIDAVKLERQIHRHDDLSWSWLPVLNEAFWQEIAESYLSSCLSIPSPYYRKLQIKNFTKHSEKL